MLRQLGWLLLSLAAWSLNMPACAASATGNVIERMPEDYHLYAYDDCGVADRQPHVDMTDCYNAPAFFIMSNVSVQERSAVFGKELRVAYDDLDPARSYILALTCGDWRDDQLAQRLEADGIELHGSLDVPKGQVKRVLVKVPATVTRDGKMRLRLTNRGGKKATASIIELWATGEPKKMLRLTDVLGTPHGLSGNVTDMAYQGVRGATVRLARSSNRQTLATTTAEAGGAFTFSKATIETLSPKEDLEVIARHGQEEARKTVSPAQQSYQPVRFRPLATAVAGLKDHELSLDGAWRINPDPDQAVREKPLDMAGWGDFRVPGQWAQQGYDIPEEKTVAVARQFAIPADWAGYRIFLRFDAIHGGTHYWLNGKPLGYSENLFTPVEWEITDAARPGETNRLDLAMLVATKSEELSHSCFYTKYTLGGIDRAVRIYALPKLHIATMHVNAGLDRTYRDGQLQVALGLDNPETTAQTGLEASIQLYDAAGKPVDHSMPKLALDPLKPGQSKVSIKSQVPHPLKWNAEQPNLYKFVVELSKDGRLVERIERHVGFRTIETKGRQLYVNGVRVKLAGVCRHEIDPLTGRADTMRHGEEDVKLYKRANLNDVRTSHYPCTQEFLDAADRLGLYVELEAPLCWVTGSDGLADLPAILTPTSAMIDACHAHPSVITYSLANESHWSPLFELSNKLCKQLDPARPTTFNNPTPAPKLQGDLQKSCDIANQHYPTMPYDKVQENDPRPFMIGECFFEVYHERTDVTINPGLRELWAHGSAEPNSAWGKFCTANYMQPTRLRPGVPPGAWSHIYDSQRCVGSEIWSGVDDIAIMKDGKIVSCENGNALWGVIDGWRRPKPEMWMSKAVFAPVWFPRRQVDYQPGQAAVRVPVENRYSFTDLSQLTFTWELDGATGKVAIQVPPAAKGAIEIPVPQAAPAGKKLLLRATDSKGELVNGATITLGTPPARALPQPRGGAPKWKDDGNEILIEGKGFALVVDRAKGDFDAASPKHNLPLVHFPALHVTRMDFGDIGWGKPPFAEFPDAKTRVVEKVTVAENADGLEIAIKDRYQDFAGIVRWLIDKNGVGQVSHDYAYAGKRLDTREVGIEALLRPQYDEVRWRRWSEWGDIFPDDSISRTAGRAKARRGQEWPKAQANVRPAWPWSLDETALGTGDFRAIKFNIYDASLVAPDGAGIGVRADADLHFRACLADNGVKMHVLTQCTLAPVVLNRGDRVKGKCAVELIRK